MKVDEIERLMERVEHYAQRNLELRAFLLRLIDPEDLGHAVRAEVREQVCYLLRIPR